MIGPLEFQNGRRVKSLFCHYLSIRVTQKVYLSVKTYIFWVKKCVKANENIIS